MPTLPVLSQIFQTRFDKRAPNDSVRRSAPAPSLDACIKSVCNPIPLLSARRFFTSLSLSLSRTGRAGCNHLGQL
ncbi:hypothetical protein chiPu_0021418 [Chiloscyllium punctatum]|uniref:Uncharacterized protein n=1 Tax=Chiloscyllium punctatum TaxID=137246 RepID=A0A401RET5_CHIPU|nr:hypothetical protein [Chiloscyllium punctatum]